MRRMTSILSSSSRVVYGILLTTTPCLLRRSTVVAVVTMTLMASPVWSSAETQSSPTDVALKASFGIEKGERENADRNLQGPVVPYYDCNICGCLDCAIGNPQGVVSFDYGNKLEKRPCQQLQQDVEYPDMIYDLAYCQDFLWRIAFDVCQCYNVNNPSLLLSDIPGYSDRWYGNSGLPEEPTAPPTTSNPVDPATSCTNVSDYFNDTTCPYTNDNWCDVPLSCPAGSDCADCDVCRGYDLTSCETCVAVPGCTWCATEAACLATPHIPYLLETEPHKLSCRNDDTDIASSLAQCMMLQNDNVFADVKYYEGSQWAYDLIDIEPVWRRGITGQGVHIRVNDVGVDAGHPDFVGRFDVSSSCDVYMPLNSTQDHGTTCAAIAAAGKDGCSVGIAPDATISACNMIGEGSQDFSAGDTYLYDDRMINVDVSSNSYGPLACFERGTLRQRHLHAGSNTCPFLPFEDGSPCLDFLCEGADWEGTTILSDGCNQAIKSYCTNPLKFEIDVKACTDFLYVYTGCYYPTNVLENPYIELGITNGRNGKGVIYVFSTGNEYENGDMVNNQQSDAYLSTRYTISVAAVGKDGLAASYSTSGPAAFISAPGGDLDHLTSYIVAKAFGTCHDSGPGTSFSCPVVAGVAALLLQVNPELTWRDVRGILASTAKRVEDAGDHTWVVNGAGIWHSDRYGFGLVQASAAVDAAEEWEPYAPEMMVSGSSGPLNIPIAEYTPESDPMVTTATVQAPNDFVVETVYIFVELQHNTRGHLNLTLTSPWGTSSVVHPGKRNEFTKNVDSWKSVTHKKWGESASGDWILSIEDNQRFVIDDAFFDDYYGDDDDGDGGDDDDYYPEFAVEELLSWRLEVYGRIEVPPDTEPPSPRPRPRPRPMTKGPIMMAKGKGYKGVTSGGVRGGVVYKKRPTIFKKIYKKVPVHKVPVKKVRVNKVRVANGKKKSVMTPVAVKKKKVVKVRNRPGKI